MTDSNSVTRQPADATAVSLVTVLLDSATISSISRLASQTLGASFAGNLEDYLSRNRDFELVKTMQKSVGSLCVINVDGDFELAMETASSLQQLLGERVLLIAISSKSSPDRILQAMRSGYAEYLESPLSDDQFRDSLVRLRRRWSVVQNVRPARLLAFIGARGGVGATSLAVHLSTFVAQVCGKRVLIVDQHRQFGHVALYLGLPTPTYHFYDLVGNVDRIDSNLLEGFIAHEVNGVDVLPGPDGLFALTEVSIDAIQLTLRYLRGAYEYVVIDCCQGIGGANEAVLAESDQIYLVATPDVPALHDLSRYVDRLLQYNFPADKVNIVINRCRSKGELALREISDAVKLPVAISIANNSMELITAMNTGKPVSPASRSDFAKQMRNWATSVAASGDSKRVAQRSPFAFWNSHHVRGNKAQLVR